MKEVTHTRTRSGLYVEQQFVQESFLTYERFKIIVISVHAIRCAGFPLIRANEAVFVAVFHDWADNRASLLKLAV